MTKRALIVGNSDGIGLGFTQRLIHEGWHVCGLSRSASPIKHDRYQHHVIDVATREFAAKLARCAEDPPELFVYCAGIGSTLRLDALQKELAVFEVNLMGVVKAIEIVLPGLLQRGTGHIIVLSSQADRLVSTNRPSYSASKSAVSRFVEGVALAVRQSGVAMSNVRFGFVDTKMAKAPSTPLMISVDQAVEHLMDCVATKPIRLTRPRLLAVPITLLSWWTRLKYYLPVH